MKIGNKEMVKSIHPESVTPELFESRSSPNGRRKYSNTTFQSSLEHPSQLTWSLKSPETNLGTWEGGKKGGREWEREWEREWGGGGGKRGSSSQEIKTAERWVKPSQYIRIYIRQSWKDSSFQEEGNTHQKNPSGIPRESPENLEGIAEYPNPPGDGEKVERGGVVLERAGLILARRGGRRRGDGWWPLTEDLALLRYFNQSPRNLRSVHTPNPCSSLKDNILIFFSYKHIHTSTSFSVWFEFIWVWSVRFFSFGCYRCFVDCDSAAP